MTTTTKKKPVPVEIVGPQSAAYYAQPHDVRQKYEAEQIGRYAHGGMTDAERIASQQATGDAVEETLEEAGAAHSSRQERDVLHADTLPHEWWPRSAGLNPPEVGPEVGT